jgi:trk system potassium uptake protein TrkA
MERFAVIGMGRFGKRLSALLAEAGAEVIAVDREKTVVDEIRDTVTLAVCLDSTDEDALQAQGIHKVDVVIVGIGSSFEANLLTTVVLKQLGVPRVISRATTDRRAKILMSIGADSVANPELESAARWRSQLLAPSLMERLDLADGYSLTQVAAPEIFHNKTLEELDVRKKHKITVAAIRRSPDSEKSETETNRRSTRLIKVPMPETRIRPGDILLVIGSDEAIEALANL